MVNFLFDLGYILFKEFEKRLEVVCLHELQTIPLTHTLKFRFDLDLTLKFSNGEGLIIKRYTSSNGFNKYPVRRNLYRYHYFI